METRRLYIPGCERQEPLTLRGERAHYLRDVLRCRAGDSVALFCGDGHDYTYCVVTVSRKQVTLNFEGVTPVATDPTEPLVLVQAYLKTHSTDEVVRAATALGITHFIPFRAVRSVGNPSASHVRRWERVAIAAAQQCGRTTLPVVSAPSPSLRTALENAPIPRTAGGWLCVWEGARDAPWPHQTRPQLLVVGPEGGLAPTEIGVAEKAGCVCVGLGPRILRADLAPIVALAWSTQRREQPQGRNPVC